MRSLLPLLPCTLPIADDSALVDGDKDGWIVII